VFWYWFFVAPALALALLSLRGERTRAAYVELRLSETVTPLPPATVIVPVKGMDDGLRENLAALTSLDYPDYELLITARRATDIPPGVLPSGVKVVLGSGDMALGADGQTSEKVQNLGAGVRAARQRSQILAFADSDGRVTPRWLRALAVPLAEESVGAATGFRWFAPGPPGPPPRFWSLLRSVWDAVIIGRLGPGDNPFAWGGAMALRKEVFFGARVLEFWKGAVSDDYALAEAVQAAGLTIAYAPGALTPCLEGTTARQLLSWTRRQLTLTRVYRPRLWWEALAAHFFYCGGMTASAIASIRGHRLAEWALIAQLSPGMLKGLNRTVLAKAALPEWEAWFKRHAWVHAVWNPLATWLWLAALAASACGNSIRWRGHDYVLQRRKPPERV